MTAVQLLIRCWLAFILLLFNCVLNINIDYCPKRFNIYLYLHQNVNCNWLLAFRFISISIQRVEIAFLFRESINSKIASSSIQRGVNGFVIGNKWMGISEEKKKTKVQLIGYAENWNSGRIQSVTMNNVTQQANQFQL